MISSLGLNEVPAFLALVTVCIFIAAMRTGAHYVPVGKKTAGLFVIILLCCFFSEFTFVIKIKEKLRRSLIMNLI